MLCALASLRLLVRVERWVQGAASERGREAQGRPSDGLHELCWSCHVRRLYTVHDWNLICPEQWQGCVRQNHQLRPEGEGCQRSVILAVKYRSRAVDMDAAHRRQSSNDVTHVDSTLSQTYA